MIYRYKLLGRFLEDDVYRFIITNNDITLVHILDSSGDILHEYKNIYYTDYLYIGNKVVISYKLL